MTIHPYLLNYAGKWPSYKIEFLTLINKYRFQGTRHSQPSLISPSSDTTQAGDAGFELLGQPMKRVLFLTLLLMMPFLGAVAAEAANHYVRAGASGSANGNDWTNAYTTLPATLTRGDTYYIADGVYGGYTFDDPVSGTTVITIKKATISNHGTDTGWSNTFGDGQAVFGSKWSIQTSNWVFDGAVRDESNWFNASAYGFSVGNNTEESQILIQNYGKAPDNVTIQYVYLPGWAAALPSITRAIYAVRVDDLDGRSESTGLIFRRMYVSGSNNVWFLRTTRGALLEYSASDGVKSNGANHGEIVNAYFSTFNATIRYNIFRNAYLDSGGTALIAIAVNRSQAEKPQLDIYGNVFYNYLVGDGAIGFTGNSVNGGNCTNCRVYNNTFANSRTNMAIQFPDGSGNSMSNNIFMNFPGTPICDIGSAGTVSSNAFGPGSGGSCGGTNAQVGLPTSLFVDFAGGNFRLKSNTNSGVTLPTPYDRDMLNAPRVSGAWSRGAFQAGAGDTAPPPAPLVSPPAPTGLTVK